MNPTSQAEFIDYLLIILVYALCRFGIGRLIEIDFQLYSKPVLFFQFRVWFVVMIPICILLVFPELRNWSNLDPSHLLDNFVLTLTWTLAWIALSLQGNPYTRQRYIFDRFILIISAISAYLSPVFVISTLLIALILRRQVFFPRVVHCCFHHIGPIIQLLTIFTGFLLVRPWVGVISPIVAITMLGAFMSYYAVPGIEKLMMGHGVFSWICKNETECITANSSIYGWFGFLSQPVLLRLLRQLGRFRLAMNTAVIGIELSSLICLLSSSLAYLVYAALIVFHTIVFLLSGLLFWPWMVVAAACISLTRHSQSLNIQLFGFESFLIGLVLIGAAPCLFRPARLAWWDSRLCNVFRVWVRGASGQRYRALPLSMAPYERAFGHGLFRFLSPQAVLVAHLGHDESQHAGVASAFWNQPTAAVPIEEIRLQNGDPAYDEAKSAELAEFLHTYFTSLNSGFRRHVLPWYFCAPGEYGFWWSSESVYAQQEIAHEVIVDYIETYYNGSGIFTIKTEEVMQIKL